ncbi:FAD-binding domain-containing protein [Plenodomus tracheiphilus IPT5]|uniref:FAD-binding domain-containing protein n=1 Tax=Plenodomus tracheiphilus IPT5 TaxID=1408161 RepID=A0A6A7B6Z2_9PLEO|nr:FAD-binding domain-containing protein [Plenodomus tracheiphilus IPT5]
MYFSLLTFLALTTGALGAEKNCKCFPGDSCWPSDKEWSAFNATVGGRLIKTVPLGSQCHDPNYDEALCQQLQKEWLFSPVHVDSSSSIQAPIFANASCDPFTPRSTPCLLGNYVTYSVNVTGSKDVAATLKFAKKKNIRLVIRNTGHDYVGRSTGAGSLAIWTHNLRSTEVQDWCDDEYCGKALKMGSGALGSDAFLKAGANNLTVVTGECPTVGLAGGYTQSGGHSPLSSTFGLGADNTLAFEVVTADGELVTASRTSSKHSDLFWALSGAGAGNYGVVVSMTVRAHPEAITTGANFTIADPSLNYSAIHRAWHAALPAIVDSGLQITYYTAANVVGALTITGYNRTKSDVQKALAPFIKSISYMNYTVKPDYAEFSSYHDYYLHTYGPLPGGAFGAAGEWLMGGRLLLRQQLQSVGPMLDKVHNLGVVQLGQAQNVARFATPKVRAVLPQWRDTVVMSSYVLPWSFQVPFANMSATQDFITDTVMPIVEAATPGAGAYINEADFQEKNWQTTFFGANYKKLLDIKHKYDPKGLFYNSIAVASEKWAKQSDGRLCRT